MLERQVVIPSSPDRLWDALTDPECLAEWFGSRVDWDLRPGGDAHFLDDDGSQRRGTIGSVTPGRHLSFRWWPQDDQDDQDDGAGAGAASEVAFTLDEVEAGTRLTVTEQLLPGASMLAAAPRASAMPGAHRASAGAGRWTTWDSRLFRCWARAASPAARLASC